MAKLLIIAGLILIIVGVILYFVPELLSWFGKLPGDINIKDENGQIFIPITTMVIISLLLTIAVNVFFRK